MENIRVAVLPKQTGQGGQPAKGYNPHRQKGDGRRNRMGNGGKRLGRRTDIWSNDDW